jgi:hypothetical protein
MSITFPESQRTTGRRDRLLELFAPGMDSLVIYSFMFPRDPGDERPGPQAGQTALLPLAEGPCPSCTAFLDQLDGAAKHASQRITSRWSRSPRCRASTPSPRSAAGGGGGCCPRPTPPTTATTTLRRPRDRSGRC